MRRWSGPILIAGATLLAFSPVARASGFKIVANDAVRVGSLSKAEASRIFLKKQTTWPGGLPAVAVDQTLSSKVRAAFSEDVHQKAPAAIDAYWQKQIFSGRDVPPVTKTSDAEVIAFVKATRGGIGYVSADATAEGVRVIELK